MCGIFAYLGKIEKQTALLCTNRLAHRGPDGVGIWQDGEVTLGHRRLAILDLSSQGHQPMSYAEGRYWITFNGEIYNFIEVRKELESCGCRFRSQSDTEVILAAYSVWGSSCVEKFNGMWAFCLWDQKEKSLYVSRDRMGKKPIFYTHLPTGLAFASEMKALLPLISNPEPNIELITDHHRIFDYASTEKCLIRQVCRFPRASHATVDSQQRHVKPTPFWDILDNLVGIAPTFEEQAEQFRELFLDACKIRMRSDVPIGSALSGGLDSSSVAVALAELGKNAGSARMSKNWQNLFCASFPMSSLDETHYARQVSKHLKLDLKVVNIEGNALPSKIMNQLYLFEELYITPPTPFIMLYEEIRRAGIVVSLDGHGADELFCGYETDVLLALRAAPFSLSAARDILGTYRDMMPPSEAGFGKTPKPCALYLNWWCKQIARELRGRVPHQQLAQRNHPNWGKLDYLGRRLYFTTFRKILPTLLRNYDRYSMAASVEVRMPFLDHRIVSFAFSLPWHAKIHQGYTKAVIREGLRDLLPESIRTRKLKIGWNAPVLEWMQGPLKEYLLDIVVSKDFRECNLVNAPRARKLLDFVLCNSKANFDAAQKTYLEIQPYLWQKALFEKREDVQTTGDSAIYL